MNFDELQSAWKQRQSDLDDDRIDALAQRARSRSSWLEVVLWWRDLRESVAALAVMAFFSYVLFDADGWVTKSGAVVILLGSVLALVVLYWARRSRPQHAQPLNEFCAAQLDRIDRQILILRNVTWWYSGPLIAGACLIVIGRGELPWLTAIMCACFIAFGWFVHWLNQRAVEQTLVPLHQEMTEICSELEESV